MSESTSHVPAQPWRARIAVIKGVPMATSLAVAEHFEKLHKDVLERIRGEIAAHDDLEFTNEHFVEAIHYTERGKPIPIFRLTEIGFSLIAMGFTGAKAKRWQRIYAQTFMDMRQALVAQTQPIPDELTTNPKELYILYHLMRSRARLAEERTRELDQQVQQLKLSERSARREFAEAVAQRQMAHDFITQGCSDESAQVQVIELQRDLSEVIVQAEIQRMDFEDNMYMFRLHQSPPSLERYCSSEIFVRLLTATGYKVGSALVLWALLQARALDTPASVWQPKTLDDVSGRRVIEPHNVPMRTVLEQLGNTLTKESIYAAMGRMVARGLVREVQAETATNRRPYRCYQLRLPQFIACLESVQSTPLLSIGGDRTDLALRDEQTSGPSALLLDEFNDFVGSRAAGFSRNERMKPEVLDDDADGLDG